MPMDFSAFVENVGELPVFLDDSSSMTEKEESKDE